MMETGTILDGKYRVFVSLGQGGFANVFLAEDIDTSEKLVVKIPFTSQLGDPAVHERFKREMEIGKLLSHPDIPSAVAVSEGNHPFLVLEYVEGESLASVLNERGKFPVDEALGMVANLLEALDYCHSRGVYHRDLKPENLLLAPDGRLKIIDFGIALMEGSTRVTWRGFSGLMGTPEYMAPEQIRGDRGGPESDIYAVGCLTYHLLSGSPPFVGENPLTVMYQHMTKNADPLPPVMPHLHPGVWAVIRRAMRRRKHERYSSAKAMAKDLLNPDNVDLRWTREPDPPMVKVASQTVTTGRQNGFLVGSIITLLIFCLTLLYMLLEKH